MLNISIETNTKLTQAEQTKYAQYDEREDRKAFLAELEKASQVSQPAQVEKQRADSTKSPLQALETKGAESNDDQPYNSEQSIASKPHKAPEQLNNVESGDKVTIKERVQMIHDSTQPVEQISSESDTTSSHSVPDTPLGLDTSSLPQEKPKKLDEALQLDKPVYPILPKALDEKLALDDSNLPVGEDNGVFEQIQASKKQTTDVQHNLAPVPKMLKDVLAQFNSSGEKVGNVNTDPVQDIAPPDLGGENADEQPKGTAVKSEPDIIEFDKSRRAIDTVWPIMGKKEHEIVTDSKTELAAEDEKIQLQAVLGGKEATSAMNTTDAKQVVTPVTAQILNKEAKVINELEKSVEHSKENKTDSIRVDGSRKGMDQVGPIIEKPGTMQSSIINSTVVQDNQPKELKNNEPVLETFVSTKAATSVESEPQVMKAQPSDASNVKPQPVTAAQVNPETKIDPQVKISAEGQITAKLDTTQPLTANIQSKEVTSEKFVGKELNEHPKALLNQINNLSQEEKVQLKQSLQHAINGGQLKPQQVKDAEQVLATLKEVEKAPEQSAKFTGDKVTVSNTTTQTSTSSAVKPEATDSYNSTKVTAQTLTESAQKNEQSVKVAVEQQKSTEQVKQMEPAQVTTKAPVSAQVEQVFRSITQQPLPNTQADLHSVDLAQSTQQFESAVQNAQSQQSVSNGQRAQLEANLVQPINIQRNDAVKALQEKVNMMLNINNKQAEIRLDPPELGSMQIRIRSEGEQAQVNFVVQNQQAKEALEQSMPKLKEMLAEQGIQLGESNIQQDNGSSNEQGFEQSQDTDNSRLANQDAPEQNSQQTKAKASSDGSGVDYYA